MTRQILQYLLWSNLILDCIKTLGMEELHLSGRTVIDFPFTTKCQSFFLIGFVLVLSSFPPGGHEDGGNVWRKVLLCEGVPDKGQTIKCRLLCRG